MPVGAILSGVGGIAGQVFKGGGRQTQQGFLDPQQAGLLASARGRFDPAIQDLNLRSIQAANQAQAGLGQIAAGQLDPASQALISQNVDRNRRLQAARQASLASQFGPGSAVSNILGRQGGLRADLALNQQSFQAFRDQIDRQRSQEQGLANILGLRGAGVSALGQGLAAQQRTAGLTAGRATERERSAGDIIGGIGNVFGRVGQGFSTQPAGAPSRSGLQNIGGGRSIDPRFVFGT